MSIPKIYEISFVPYNNAEGTNISIVFTIDTKHFEKIKELLAQAVQNDVAPSKKYFGRHMKFCMFEENLFTYYEFGYGRSGEVVHNGHTTDFVFHLPKNYPVRNMVRTINLLVMSLNYILFDKMGDEIESDQMLRLDTIATHGMHGHSIGGDVFNKLFAWLRLYGDTIPDKEPSAFTTLTLPEVGGHMRTVWNHIMGDNLKEYLHECRAHILVDGRFILTCPGDACDVSIYPDLLGHGPSGRNFVQFACHNLDTPYQQVTLLAGLATLCDLARTS